jgi:hypothetical protein
MRPRPCVIIAAMRTAQRPGRLGAQRPGWRALLAIVAVAALVAGLIRLLDGGPDRAEVRSVEAESFQLSSGQGSVVADGSASGGKALRMWGNDTAAGSITLPETRSLLIRARGEQCSGPPKVVVRVDDRPVLAAAVTSPAWADYTARASVGAGSHRVRVDFAEDLAGNGCDRNLELDSVTFAGSDLTKPRTAAPSGQEPAGTARTVFAADMSDGIAEYPYRINDRLIDVVDDPVLGAERKVLRFRVGQGDLGPTENPRAQVETGYDFQEGDDRYFGFSILLPDGFPDQLPDRAWITIGEQAYTAEGQGPGGTSLRIQNGTDHEGAVIRWERNDTYGFDRPWIGPKVADVRGRWIDFVQRIKLHHDPHVGFVELWMNAGQGWAKQRLAGQERLYMNTYDAANGHGPNNSRLSLYYRADIPGPLTLYHGAHRIATAGTGAFEAVAPTSYGPAPGEPRTASTP